MGEKRELTRRGRERRDKLLAYATARFAQNGFHPTSVSDIVNGIGVGKGVFYWYFESKDQLLIEILREALRGLRSAQAAAMAGADDPLRQLEAGIRASIDWSAANTDITRLVMFGWSEEAFANELRKGRDIVVADTARLIDRAMAEGHVAEGDPIMMALAIRAVIDQLAREYATGGTGGGEPGSDRDHARMVETTVRMCLRGVRG
jgi:AcrR family transcriptional regulator